MSHVRFSLKNEQKQATCMLYQVHIMLENMNVYGMATDKQVLAHPHHLRDFFFFFQRSTQFSGLLPKGLWYVFVKILQRYNRKLFFFF